MEVVGVVRDVPSGPLDRAWPMVVYEPYPQVSPVGMSFALRATTDPVAVARAARAVLSSIDPEMALPPARTMEQILDASVAAALLLTGLVACWAPALRATRINPLQALRCE